LDKLVFEFCFVSKSRKNCGFFCAYMLCICSNKGEKSEYISFLALRIYTYLTRACGGAEICMRKAKENK